jgi:hypothetical protein
MHLGEGESGLSDAIFFASMYDYINVKGPKSSNGKVAIVNLIEVRSADRVSVRSRIAYAVMYVVIIGCIAWFIFAMRDPNYRWSFIDDDVMRARNVLACLVLTYGIFMVRRIQLMTAGRIPAAVLTKNESTVTVNPARLGPLLRAPVERVTAPISVRFREDKGVSFIGKQHLRSISIKGKDSSSSIVSFGPWEEGTEERVREFLADLMERPEATANE